MTILKFIGISLLIAGVLGLVYNRVSFTREVHETNFGPLTVAVTEDHHVKVPLWAGVSGIILGIGFIAMKNRS